MILLKTIFLILDGMADDPKGGLLSGSDIPNLDALASQGRVGRNFTVRGQEPESDVAIVRLFGYDTTGEGYPGRGPLEAYGAGLIKPEDEHYLAFRANFATFSQATSIFKASVMDSRVGRTLTSAHAHELAEALNDMARERFKDVEIVVYPTVEHRAVVVFKGRDFNPHISNLDPFYIREKDGTTRAIKPEDPVMQRSVPLQGDPKTSELANSFMEEAYKLLSSYTIPEREENGLKTANGLLMRNAGNSIIDLKSVLVAGLFPEWDARVGMPMERGIAMAGGMGLSTFDYPQVDLKTALKARDDPSSLYDHFMKNLETEVKQYADYLKSPEGQALWLHCKPMDIAGHDGSIGKKREMLERVDSTIVARIRELVESGQYAAVITSDHATVCSKKKHTQDPVPLLIAGLGKDDSQAFTEEAYMKSGLEIDGPQLFSKSGPLKG